MGWTWSYREKGLTNREFFEAELQFRLADREILADATIDRTYYAAVRNKSNGEVWALVCLTHWVPRDRQFNFGYKDMDETVGPCEIDCPAKILDLLSPTESEYAIGWRERCRARIAAKAAKPKVKSGDRIRFATPLTFTNGDELAEFEFVARSTFRPLGAYGRYSIPRWKDRQYEVIA